jgi:hypothetical protein
MMKDRPLTRYAIALITSLTASCIAVSAEEYDATDIGRCGGVILFTAEMSSAQGDEVAAGLLRDRVRGAWIASTALLIGDGWTVEKATESVENWKRDGFLSASTSPELYEKMSGDCLPILEYQAEVLNHMRKEGLI